MWAPGYEYLESALKTTTPKVLIAEDVKILHYQELNVIVKQYRCKYKRLDVYEREFHVGLKINEYNSPYMVKTLGYYQIADKRKPLSCLVTEYVPGETFRDVLDKRPSVGLCQQVVHMIKHLQDQMTFTHYDLHLRNIIVNITPTATTKTFIIDRDEVTIVSPYTIKFIDFGFSHMPGLEPAYYPGVFTMMLCSGIYDPLYDYSTFLAGMCLFLNDPDLDALLKDLFRKNLLNIKSHGKYRFGAPITAPINLDDFPLEQQCMRGIWATDQACNRTFDDVIREYNRISPVTPQIVDTYIKLLCEVHVHYKLEQMKLRQSTSTEFFHATINFLNQCK